MARNPKKFRTEHDRRIHGHILQLPEAIEALEKDKVFMAKLELKYEGYTHSKRKIAKHIKKRAKKTVLKQAKERKKYRA